LEREHFFYIECLQNICIIQDCWDDLVCLILEAHIFGVPSMTVRKRSLPAVGGDPLRSRMAPRDPNHPAWKTSLCRYWKEGSCFKRDSECAFRHGSEQLPAAFRKAPYSENAGNVSGADGTATQLVVWKESVAMQCSSSHSEDNSTNAGPYVEKEPRYPRPTKRPRSLSPTPSKNDPIFQQQQHQSDKPRTAAVPISTTLETAGALPRTPPKPVEELPLTFSTGTLKPCVEDWLHQARMERLVQPYSLQGSSLQFKFEHDMT
jgi:hypothetical protein